MKNNIILKWNFGIYIFITTLSMSCVTSKPDSFYSSSPDYNQRISVQDAHYRTIISPLGNGFVLAGVAGGAYVGYNYNGGLVTQRGETRKPIRPLNALIGATAGFATSQLILHLLGKNRKHESTNAYSWVRDVNKNYILIDKSSETNFEVIPKQAEFTYIIKNIDDTKGFYKAFPSSMRTDQIFLNSIQNLQRFELPELINLDASNIHLNEAKYKYFDAATSVKDLFESSNRFTDFVYPVEEKASQLVFDMSDLVLFQERFGLQSQFNDVVFNKVYQNIEFLNLIELIDQYPKVSKRNEAITLAISKCVDMQDIDKVMKYYNQFKSEIENRAEEIVFQNTQLVQVYFQGFIKRFPNATRLHKSQYSTYLGDWDIKQKRPQGKGVKWEPNYKRFELGNFNQGLLEDINGYSTDPQQTYSGGFIKGNYYGTGSLKEIGKGWESEYTGEFKDGQENGYGNIVGSGVLSYFPFNVDSRSAKYTGNWTNGYPDGSGKLETNDGETWYSGSFDDGEFDGEGELRMPFGVRYTGKFKHGAPNGIIKLSKWTLLGLVKSEDSVNATSWSDLIEPTKKVAAEFNEILFGPSKSGDLPSTYSNENKSHNSDHIATNVSDNDCDITKDEESYKMPLCGNREANVIELWCKNGRKGHYFYNAIAFSSGLLCEYSVGFYVLDLVPIYVGKNRVGVTKEICNCD
ncbi:MAG: hypothetical protein WBP41_08065 [Saprospiraceae bacterium]